MPEEQPALPGFRFVSVPDALEEAVARASRARAVAVDTEADSMHCYFEKVCLLQLATDTGDAWVVDPLELKGLPGVERPFADPDVVKVFHGADFDVTGIRRDFGFEFRNIFDTMVASTLLGDAKLSLRDLVERFFGVVLEKAYTKCDWGRRPLDERQLEYSYYDVAYLVPLMDIQRERLGEADLVEEAEIEFERLSQREGSPREFDPHGWFRIQGAKDLPRERQAVLHELFALRDVHARRMDRPVFKVVGNDTLLRIAQKLPRTMDDLRGVRGVSHYVMGRMAREILAAVEEGLRVAAPPPRPRTLGDPQRRMEMSAQRRLGALKDWRNTTSHEISRTTVAILPNYAMFEVARLAPGSVAELAAIPGVGAKRADRYGKAILALVR